MVVDVHCCCRCLGSGRRKGSRGIPWITMPRTVAPGTARGTSKPGHTKNSRLLRLVEYHASVQRTGTASMLESSKRMKQDHSAMFVATM